MPTTKFSNKSLAQWLVEAICNHTNKNSCLIWPFSCNGMGYGICRFEGRDESTHRIAFFINKGRWPVPQGRHTCDNPSCFNPHHIVEGTAKQNSTDMVVRGRSGKGSRNSNAKLTDDMVRQIREEVRNFSKAYLGRKFGVHETTIGEIVRREIWKHVI